MSIFGAVARHVDQQKAELLDYLITLGATEPRQAIELTGVKFNSSILKELMNRKIVIRTSSGKYFVDVTKLDQAAGASNKFILYAMGAMILAILVLWRLSE